MKTQIERIAREQLHGTALSAVVQKQLGLDRRQSHAAIDRSVSGIAEELRIKIKDIGGAQRLYDEITEADTSIAERILHEKARAQALREATAQFDVMVGSDAKDRLVSQLVLDNTLTKTQANDVVAFASQSMVGVLKSELANGSVGNNADGLQTLLNSTDRKPAFRHLFPGGRSPEPRYARQSAGSAVINSNDHSWLWRYALPLVLLAALLLATMKFCSESKKNRLVADKRDQLELELAGAEQQAKANNAKLLTLQSDYDTAQSGIAKLETELESSQAELDALKNTDAAELRRQLDDVTTERDNAIETESGLTAQLQQTTSERDALQQQQDEARAELDAARTAITANNAAITELEAQVETLTSERDQLQETLGSEKQAHEAALAALRTEATELEMTIEQSQATIDTLNERIDALNGEKEQLDTQLAAVTAELDDERSTRLSNTNQLTAQANSLQGQLNEMTRLRDSSKDAIAQSEQNLADAEQKLVSAEQALLDKEQALTDTEQTLADTEQTLADTERTLTEARQQLADKEQQLADTEQQLTDAKNAISQKEDELAKINTELDTTRQSIASLNSANSDLEDEVQKLTAANAGSLEQISLHNEELSQRDEKITSLTGALENAKADAQSESDALVQNQQQVDELSAKNQQLSADAKLASDKVNELTTLVSEQEAAIAKLEQQTMDLNRELQSSGADKTELENTLAQLKQQQSAMQQASDSEREEALALIASLEKSLSASDDAAARLTTERDTLQRSIDVLNRQNNAQQAKAQQAALNAKQLGADIEQKIAAAGLTDIAVSTAEEFNGIAISLGSGSVFKTGDVALSRKGTEVLAKVGDIIGGYPDMHIDVEGHTDALPIGSKLRHRYPSNWELSSARASAVINYLLLTNRVEPEQVSARGFADTRPVADNNTFQGRVKNRRVDIVLRGKQ
jgi:flagellar motor protein MotB